MDNKSIFNKLWVVESLPEGELKTGTSLVENQLTGAKQKHKDLIVAFIKTVTKADLIDVLHRICDEARSEDMTPMLHIECHGCPDGLYVASGELVEWDDLREILIEINHACRLNLVIVLKLLDDANYLAVFATDQLHAQVLLFLNAFYEVWAVGLIVFGFHLLTLGYLVFKSTFIPKIFGILLIVAGLSYLIDYFGNLLFSNFDPIISLVAGWGELIFMLLKKVK